MKPIRQALVCSIAASVLRRCLRRVLDVGNRGDFHGDQMAVDLLDLANIDRLDDVTGLRIDRNRPARTFPVQAPGGVDERLAVGLAAGLLQRGVDQVHAVIAADREEVGIAVEIGIVGCHEFFVQFRVMVGVVVTASDDAERDVVHAGERMLVGDLQLAHDFGRLGIDADLGHRLETDLDGALRVTRSRRQACGENDDAGEQTTLRRVLQFLLFDVQNARPGRKSKSAANMIVRGVLS
jgi:hypothetical protein